jgi:carboxymethylenebutenolidase
MCSAYKDEAGAEGAISRTAQEGQAVFFPEPKALMYPTIVHGPLSFLNGSDTVYGYLARPVSTERARAVVVTHGNAGLPEDMCNAAAQVAQAGFVGLLLDPTSRESDPMGMSREYLMSYRYIQLLMRDIQAALAYLQTQPFVQADGTGLLGFCGGGILNLLYAATHPGIQAVVTFYAAPRTPPEQNSPRDPRPDAIDFISRLTMPLQCHFGTADAYVPMTDVADFEQALQKHQVPAEVYHYAGARHGFYHYTYPEDYDAEAALLAQQRMTAFFRQHLAV